MKDHIDQPRGQIAGDENLMARWREAQLLFNLIEPDPEYQPLYVSDEASLFDCLGPEEDEMLEILKRYFGPSFRLSLSQPVWKLIDDIRRLYPGWPEPEWKTRS